VEKAKPVQVRALLLKCLDMKLEDCEWRDGTNHRVRVRALAIPEILKFLHDKVNESDFYADEQLEASILNLEGEIEHDGVPINSTAKHRTRKLFNSLQR
jgi:hypothetical protein